MICAECDNDIGPGDFKGYVGDDAVHLYCNGRAEIPCGDCHLIHAGDCA